MKPLAVTVLCASLALLAASARAEDKKADTKAAPLKLAGEYVLVSGERNGQKEPDERIKDTKVVFSDDRITVMDKNKTEVWVATYKVDAAKKPYFITMTSVLGPTKGETAQGIIEKKGDELRLIYAVPGGELPTEFKTRDKQLLFVMKPASK